MKQLNDPPKAVIVAASTENGVEHFSIFSRSVNRAKFKIFLEEMRERWPLDRVTIVMDNLSLHKSNDVKNKMRELGYQWAWTPVYSPQFNGVESVIGQCKHWVKRERLNRILKGRQVDIAEIIEDSFGRLKV